MQVALDCAKAKAAIQQALQDREALPKGSKATIKSGRTAKSAPAPAPEVPIQAEEEGKIDLKWLKAGGINKTAMTQEVCKYCGAPCEKCEGVCNFNEACSNADMVDWEGNFFDLEGVFQVGLDLEGVGKEGDK